MLWKHSKRLWMNLRGGENLENRGKNMKDLGKESIPVEFSKIREKHPNLKWEDENYKYSTWHYDISARDASAMNMNDEEMSVELERGLRSTLPKGVEIVTVIEPMKNYTISFLDYEYTILAICRIKK